MAYSPLSPSSSTSSSSFLPYKRMSKSGATRRPFMVSAPGKVIVFGEHAVVHGKAAIAAATSLRSYLLVTFDPPEKDAVSLNFPDIGLNQSWRLSQLRLEKFSAQPFKGLPTAPRTLDQDNMRTIKILMDQVGANEQNEIKRTHLQNASKAFLYLFMSLGQFSFTSCTFTLRSTLPIGAGLGSSASLAVCLAAAMLHQRQSLTDSREVEQPEQMLNFINSWAFLGEVCLHGNPSGVDNSVATLGRAVMFQRAGGAETEATITPLRSFPEMKLLMTDTGVSRSTAKEVEKVRLLKTEYPIIVDPILESISQITVAAHGLMEANAQGRLHELPGPKLPFLEKMGKLFVMNQGLLVSLGVSHPKLERIRQITEEANIGWTKLTGAGGGGCAITLLRENPVTLKAAEKQLASEGFRKYEILLGAPGVGFHLQPDKLSKDKFQEVKYVEDIEQMTGMTEDDHLSYWRYLQ